MKKVATIPMHLLFGHVVITPTMRTFPGGVVLGGVIATTDAYGNVTKKKVENVVVTYG